MKRKAIKHQAITITRRELTTPPRKRHPAARIIAGLATAIGAIVAFNSFPQARRYIRMHRM